MRNLSLSCLTGCIALAAIAFSGQARAHGDGVTGTHVHDWHSNTIARVVSPSYSWNNLGETFIAGNGTDADVGDRKCMAAAVLNVDVRDSFAYDLDERVTLTLSLHGSGSAPAAVVRYDAAGGPRVVSATVEAAGDATQQLRLQLPRARFINRGMRTVLSTIEYSVCKCR